MYGNDIGIVLFRSYGNWPNLKTKEILSQVICIKLHMQTFEIFCYHSYNILIYTAEKVKISSFQKMYCFWKSVNNERRKILDF